MPDKYHIGNTHPLFAPSHYPLRTRLSKSRALMFITNSNNSTPLLYNYHRHLPPWINVYCGECHVHDLGIPERFPRFVIQLTRSVLFSGHRPFSAPTSLSLLSRDDVYMSLFQQLSKIIRQQLRSNPSTDSRYQNWRRPLRSRPFATSGQPHACHMHMHSR